jgi:hypothetical protein
MDENRVIGVVEAPNPAPVRELESLLDDELQDFGERAAGRCGAVQRLGDELGDKPADEITDSAA